MPAVMGLRDTPWGVADRVVDIGRGILRVDTPSHGGYYVPPHLLPLIAPSWRAFAAKWSHGRGECWYEEDCAWAGVCLAFPDLFPADAMPHAIALGKRYAAEQCNCGDAGCQATPGHCGAYIV